MDAVEVTDGRASMCDRASATEDAFNMDPLSETTDSFEAQLSTTNENKPVLLPRGSTLWVSNHAADKCQDCKTVFGLIKRKHHCRFCGSIFCDKCSDHEIESHRCCNKCYTHYESKAEGADLALLKMEAACFTKYGDPSKVVDLCTIPMPCPGKGEVLIRIRAASLNPIDIKRIKGDLKLSDGAETAFPAPFGIDAAGVITQVGEGVTEFKVGACVVASLPQDFCTTHRQGTLAQYSLCPVAYVVSKPDSISFENAAAVPYAGLAALQALRKADVSSGDNITITAGASGIGSFAIQLAKKFFQCEIVTTTVSSAENVKVVMGIGADVVVNYTEHKFQDLVKPNSQWCALDLSEEIARLVPFVAKGGSVVSINDTPRMEDVEELGKKKKLLGSVGKGITDFVANKETLKRCKDRDVQWFCQVCVPTGKEISELLSYVEIGLVKPVVKVYEWKQWKKALDDLSEGYAVGKVVVRVSTN